MTTQVTSTSTNKAVQDLTASLLRQGKILEYATLDDAGRIIGYKVRGEQLVIVPPLKQRQTMTATGGDILGNDPAQALQSRYYENQLLSFTRLPMQDTRLMWYGLGLAALVMTVLYAKGKRA